MMNCIYTEYRCITDSVHGYLFKTKTLKRTESGFPSPKWDAKSNKRQPFTLYSLQNYLDTISFFCIFAYGDTCRRKEQPRTAYDSTNRFRKRTWHASQLPSLRSIPDGHPKTVFMPSASPHLTGGIMPCGAYSQTNALPSLSVRWLIHSSWPQAKPWTC